MKLAALTDRRTSCVDLKHSEGSPPPPPPAGCPLEAEVVQRRRLLVFRTQKKKGKRGKGS